MLDLPIYNACISDETDGIWSVSLVNSPATEYTMMLFNSDRLDFTVEDEDKHIIKTVVMLANTPIYRNDWGYEYYVTYSKETLSYMAQKMLRDNTHQNFDLEHNGAILPKGSIELIELFQKDIDNGINPNGFENVADGSLLATYKVNDEGLWNMCKNGTFTGISLSGFFNLTEEQFSKIKQKESFNMTLNNLKNLIKDILLNFNSQESNIGNVFYSGDEIMQGTALTDKDGNPIADGEVLIDGYKLIVENGMVKEMNPIEEEAPSTEEEPQEEPIIEEVKEDEPKEDETPIEEETPTEEQPTEETPIEEQPTEEIPTDEPTEDVTPLVEEPQPNADIEALKTEVESLKVAISDLLKKISTPAEKPIIEEFSAVSENEKNIPSNIKKLMGYAKYLK